jgi:hypothetical protein
LLGGIEVRYALIYFPTVLEVKLVGFYDTGRVFGSNAFQLTTRDLHSSAGGELMIRFGRNGVLVAGAGFGSDGHQFLFGSSWSY